MSFQLCNTQLFLTEISIKCQFIMTKGCKIPKSIINAHCAGWMSFTSNFIDYLVFLNGMTPKLHYKRHVIQELQGEDNQ